MTKKYLLFVIISFGIIHCVEAQINTDSLKNTYDSFKKNNQLKFNDSRSENDVVFVGFLNDSWQEYEIQIIERPSNTKPKNQPKIIDLSSKAIELLSEKRALPILDTINYNRFKKNNIEKKNTFSLYNNESNFKFYGTNISSSNPPRKLPKLEEVSNSGIAKFYVEASNFEYFNYLLNQAIFYKESLKLNGWAYLKLVEQMTKTVYPDRNMQTLTIWYLLTNSGNKVKVSYSENEIFLLINFDMEIFSVSFIEIDKQQYYLFLPEKCKPKFKRLFTYRENHIEQTQALSLYLAELPDLDHNETIKKLKFKGDTVEVQMNTNLIDFYADYPDCPLEIALNTPFSHSVSLSFDSFFKSKMILMNNRNKLDYLLDFVQKAFRYKADQAQFGKENYLFADESINYPYSDCEDRVVLLAQLIRKYTNYKMVALSFPAHISLAINLNEEIDGAFVIDRNLKYYICDPTYIGAKCGMIMPEYIDVNPVIIHLN